MLCIGLLLLVVVVVWFGGIMFAEYQNGSFWSLGRKHDVDICC